LKAADVVAELAEVAIRFRYPNAKPTLAELARVCSASARVLRISDLDERLESENHATLSLARKLSLISQHCRRSETGAAKAPVFNSRESRELSPRQTTLSGAKF
jgi:hypothetical protein